MHPAYIYDSDVGNFHYGARHPMKPHRLALTHSLVHSYGIDKHMDIIQPKSFPINNTFLNEYHEPKYVFNILSEAESTTPDCPIFTGLGEYVTRYAYSTLTAAVLLNEQIYETVINWSGGLHHAKKASASGFCYINDIVIGIQELLKVYEKILYVDIDIHHGDGVEEAYYLDNRVMTLSVHKFGNEFFPGTGELFCIGEGKGKGYTVNVPLKQGIDDFSYLYVFKPIFKTAFEKFRPDVVVMQCGADSLKDDRLGNFNMSVYGHGECVKYVKKIASKLLVLGGGGYSMKNVSKCWAYETGLICGFEIENEIPKNDTYRSYYRDQIYLYPVQKFGVINYNTRKYLDVVKGQVLENLSKI